MKKIVSLILLVVWMVVIFMFSNDNAVRSHEVSHKVINSSLDIYEKVFDSSLSSDVRSRIVSSSNYFVRKAAHIFIYFVLGILMINFLHFYDLKGVVFLSVLGCFLYACTDEFHQLFTGRSASCLDVLIDSFGSYSGILCYKIVFFKKY